jgi:hypothetical protein
LFGIDIHLVDAAVGYAIEDVQDLVHFVVVIELLLAFCDTTRRAL